MFPRKGNVQPELVVISPAPAAKEKKRKSEKRKEKSRDAARSRRSRESEIFQELCEQLPVCQKSMAHLDKASLVRLAIGYLKIRQLFSIYKGLSPKTFESSSSYDSFYLPAINGFVLVMSQEGDMIYLSDNVHKYLGISQVDLLGHSIYEYSHPCDHEEVREVLQTKTESDHQGPVSLFMRMKCALSHKGKNINVRSASFKVIHCTGHLLRLVGVKASQKGSQQCLVSLGEPVPHPSNIEVPLDQQSFLSRHSLDMKFTYVDQRMSEVLGYKSEDIMGKSVYLFYHACDASLLEKSFKILFSKGQSETGRYRFLAKRGGFVWLLTQATLIYDSGSSKPRCVVCVNYVLSGHQKENEVVSLEQVAACKMTPDPQPQEEEEIEAQIIEEPQIIEEVVQAVSEPNIPEEEDVWLPQANTIKIFAPRTADMNTGFLTFDSDSGTTVLKEEPEDLTHLAPQAGDVCFPLDMSISYPDLMEDTYLPCSLNEESSSLDCLHSNSDSDLSPRTSKRLKCPLTNDPFLCLREDDAFATDYGPGLKVPERMSESKKSLLGQVSNTACQTDNLDIQDDCLTDCTPYTSMNDVYDYLLSPTNSLLLETSPISSESHNLCDMEEATTTKMLKCDPLNSSKHCLNRNDLHSDGSSGCPDDYDSDPLELVPPAKMSKVFPGLFSKVAVAPSTILEQNFLLNDARIVSNMDTVKQTFTLVPEPPTKRNGPQPSGPTGSPKKMKIDPRLIQSKGTQGSVLLNLLVRGEDTSHGYLCPANQNLKYKLLQESDVTDKPLNTQAKVGGQSEASGARRTKNVLF